jgi:hypothetical protein
MRQVRDERRDLGFSRLRQPRRGGGEVSPVAGPPPIDSLRQVETDLAVAGTIRDYDDLDAALTIDATECEQAIDQAVADFRQMRTARRDDAAPRKDEQQERRLK